MPEQEKPATPYTIRKRLVLAALGFAPNTRIEGANLVKCCDHVRNAAHIDKYQGKNEIEIYDALQTDFPGFKCARSSLQTMLATSKIEYKKLTIIDLEKIAIARSAMAQRAEAEAASTATTSAIERELAELKAWARRVEMVMCDRDRHILEIMLRYESGVHMDEAGVKFFSKQSGTPYKKKRPKISAQLPLGLPDDYEAPPTIETVIDDFIQPEESQ